MAERDAALRNGASGRSQFSRMMGRGSELESEKLDLARDKFDAQQSQRDLSNAFRDAQMKMNSERASQQAESAKAQLELADRRIEMQQKQHLIAEESAKLRDLQAERKTDRTLEALQQGTAFLRDARGMRPEAAEFDDQLDEMLAGYPVAAEHPAVKEWLDYNQKRRGEFLAREATKKPEKEPVVTVRETNADGKTSTTTTRQVSEADAAKVERDALLARHGALEAALNAKSGKSAPTEGELSEINALKSQLGFAQLDASGKAVESSGPPTLTAKDQFDALPSGAEYIRDGRRYRKP